MIKNSSKSLLDMLLFRPPSNYGTNHSDPPRPEPSFPSNLPESTMIPNDEEAKLNGDGYGSSKMRASNWRLMGLGNHNNLI